jgi:hypothetical protein
MVLQMLGVIKRWLIYLLASILSPNPRTPLAPIESPFEDVEAAHHTLPVPIIG